MVEAEMIISLISLLTCIRSLCSIPHSLFNCWL